MELLSLHGLPDAAPRYAPEDPTSATSQHRRDSPWRFRALQLGRLHLVGCTEMGRFWALETGCGRVPPSVRVNLVVACPIEIECPAGPRWRDVEFSSVDLVLAGWLAVPVRDEALAGVVLVGGSGPSDCDNGTYFPLSASTWRTRGSPCSPTTSAALARHPAPQLIDAQRSAAAPNGGSTCEALTWVAAGRAGSPRPATGTRGFCDPEAPGWLSSSSGSVRELICPAAASSRVRYA